MVQRIGDLSEQFNETEVRLEMTQEKLKEATETLQQLHRKTELRLSQQLQDAQRSIFMAIQAENKKTVAAIAEKDKMHKVLNEQLAGVKAENDRLNVSLMKTKESNEATVQTLSIRESKR